jgi:hypothetical protein
VIWSLRPVLAASGETNIEELVMKPFSMLKLAVPLLGFGAVLLFTPSCRAQSDVSPDHFDGTDSWETAARTAAPHTTHAPAPKIHLAKTTAASATSTLQLASDRQRSAPQRREAAAIPEKRKPAVRKSEKQ